MQKRTFGRTGLQVSPLGFGGAPVGFLDTEATAVSKLLNQLVDAGVNVIDTAASYHGSESLIGNALAARRKEIILISKCGQSFDDVPGEAWSRKVILGTIDRSLSRLRTDHLDVCLLHSCGIDILERGEAIQALVEAKRAGKIRHGGYSGDNQAAAYAAARPDIEVLQTSVNITDQYNMDHVLPIAVEHNVGVMAKRPIADAAWNKSRPGMYKSYGQVYEDRLKQMGLNAADYKLTWPQLALRFTLTVAGVHTAIVGTTNPEHAHANIQIADEGPLADNVFQSIRSAFKTADPDENWLGQT